MGRAAVPQRSGPPDIRPGKAPGNHRPDRRRERSHRWEDPAKSGEAARTLAGLDFFRAIAGGTLLPPPIAGARE
jgi:hypothetical protein